MSKIAKKRLRYLLLEQGMLTQQQFNSVLSSQRKRGGSFGENVLKKGFLSEESLVKAIAQQLNVKYLDVKNIKLDIETVKLIPEDYARTYRVLAIKQEPDHIVVGMGDPSDVNAIDALAKLLPLPASPVMVRFSELDRLQDLFYRHESEIDSIAKSIDQDTRVSEDVKSEKFGDAAAISEAPVAQMIQLLFKNAVTFNASDIHIEPDENITRIRLRIDGVLQEQEFQQKNVSVLLSSRLKIMAGLNIAEKRLPQDGHFEVEVFGRTIDVRLSTMPIRHGESVVMRILDKESGILDLDKLGMDDDMLELFRYQIARPHGMILVTGPTGSGKTTTLYGALNERNSPFEKIITVEDPVEYELPRLSQVQINPQIGLDFNRVLRSTLRQDPDVILVGEIRDQDSMEVSLRAAMTGHMVFSTLHTNDAVGTVSRLIDLGGKEYLLASSLRIIIAQRLVRRICARCKQEATLAPYEQRWVRRILCDYQEDQKFMHGVGCPMCEQTGYHGRIGVFEMVVINDKLKADLNNRDMVSFEKNVYKQKSYRSLATRAMDFALAGDTSIEEIMRETGDLYISECQPIAEE